MRIGLNDKKKTISFLRECLDTLEAEDIGHISGTLNITAETETVQNFGFIKSRPTGRRTLNMELEYFVNPPKPEPIDYFVICVDMKSGDGCLVRDENDEEWVVNVFLGKSTSENGFYTVTGFWNQCIPYMGYGSYYNTTKNPVI